MNSIIRITDFTKEYPKHKVVIKNLNITKRINILVGKNGSGKSTLLKAIAKLIAFNGEIVTDKKVCYMSEVAMYPKDISLDTFLSHLREISLSKTTRLLTDNLLENFSLLDKLNNSLDSLSKGMKAKINIVQCLMEEADIYLLDEPLSGLDKTSAKWLINYLKKSDKMYIISTHLDSDFNNICDEVFHL